MNSYIAISFFISFVGLMWLLIEKCSKESADLNTFGINSVSLYRLVLIILYWSVYIRRIVSEWFLFIFWNWSANLICIYLNTSLLNSNLEFLRIAIVGVVYLFIYLFIYFNLHPGGKPQGLATISQGVLKMDYASGGAGIAIRSVFLQL